MRICRECLSPRGKGKGDKESFVICVMSYLFCVQTMKFMRSTHYDQRSCLALWTCPPSPISNIVPSDFNVIVRKFSIGKGSLKRELLKMDFNDTVYKKGVNTVRRSCLGLYLDDGRWPQSLLKRLTNGKGYILDELSS